MILNNPFQSSEKKEELLLKDSSDFPYVCNYADFDSLVQQCIPWHWHAALEIDYVAGGNLILETLDHRYPLKEGDVFFINSGVMHRIYTDGHPGGQIYAHLFDASFLGGSYNSRIQHKYLLPVIKNNNIQALIFHPDNIHQIDLVKCCIDLITLNQDEPFGREFELRSTLGSFWIMLLKEIERQHIAVSEKNNADAQRIKLMLQYIHEHYMEHLSLDSIAASANISTRECTRCFQRCIKLSPVSYLNHYRIHEAARMLLHTEDSILSISENCGFSSGSYFGKAFREVMGCTPNEYRIAEPPA